MKPLPQSFIHNGEEYFIYHWKTINGYIVGYKTLNETNKYQAYGHDKPTSAQSLINQLNQQGINPYKD